MSAPSSSAALTHSGRRRRHEIPPSTHRAPSNNNNQQKKEQQVMNRYRVALTATAIVAVGLPIAVFGGGVASAHHPEISVDTDCTDSGWDATYTVNSDADRNLTWSVNGEPAKPDDQSFEFVESFGFDVTSDSFSATATWSNGAGPETRSASATRPEGCVAPTTTTAPPIEQPDHSGSVECAEDGSVLFTLTNNGPGLLPFTINDGDVFFLDSGQTIIQTDVPEGAVIRVVAVSDLATVLATYDLGVDCPDPTTTTLPPPDPCSWPAVKTNSQVCGSYEFLPVCGSISGTASFSITNKPTWSYGAWFSEEEPTNFEDGTADSLSFPEDYNGGWVNVYAWIGGTENDVLANRGLPTFGAPQVLVVITDCIAPPPNPPVEEWNGYTPVCGVDEYTETGVRTTYTVESVNGAWVQVPHTEAISRVVSDPQPDCPAPDAEVVCTSTGPDYVAWQLTNTGNVGIVSPVTLAPGESAVIESLRDQQGNVSIEVEFADGSSGTFEGSGEGCVFTPPVTTTPPPTTEPPVTEPPVTEPPSTDPPVTTTPPTTISPETTAPPVTDPSVPTTPAPTPPAAPPVGELPATGASSLLLALVGALLGTLGIGLIAATRRQS